MAILILIKKLTPHHLLKWSSIFYSSAIRIDDKVMWFRFNLPADPEKQPSRVRRSQSQPRLSQVVSRLEQETMSFSRKKTQAKRRTLSVSRQGSPLSLHWFNNILL